MGAAVAIEYSRCEMVGLDDLTGWGKRSCVRFHEQHSSEISMCKDNAGDNSSEALAASRTHAQFFTALQQCFSNHLSISPTTHGETRGNVCMR